MLLNLKLSQERAISHLANIEAKILGNMVSARRNSFLARSKVARNQQLKNYLCTTSMTHSALFAGQVTAVAKELVERKRRQPVPHNWRTSTSSTSTPNRIMPHGLELSLPNPGSSHQPLPASSTQVTPGNCRAGMPHKDLQKSQKSSDWTGWWPPPVQYFNLL